VVVDDDLVALQTSFLQHIGEEVLVNVVVEVFDGDFDLGWFSHVVLVDG
jgi:hypothetical protein